jgi:hypothetical protein
MGLGSFFKKVGVDLEKVISAGAKVAAVAEPVVDILFPAVATLYNSAVNEAVTALSAGQAAAAQGGSTTVELENIAAAIEPQLVTYLQGQGLPAPTAAHINAFTQSILASLQVLVAIENGTPLPTVVTQAAPASSTAATSGAGSAAAPSPAAAPVLAAA